MKRIALTLLASSFALTQFAAAEDQPQPVQPGPHVAPVRRSAPAPRLAPVQGQRAATAGGLRQPTFRPQQTQGMSPRFNPNIGRQPQFRGQANGSSRLRLPSANPTRQTAPTTGVSADQNPAVTAVTPTARGSWRSGNNGDWRSRNTGVNGRLSNRAQDGVNQDARTRTGGSGNWSNRGGGNSNWRHDRSHHDRNWYRSRYSRFAQFGGGYYYWDSGFWYPAYGYDPYFSTYAYDAPIYSYNDAQPEQVMSDVQAELARRGYYNGAIDGTYGPQTREALLRYQQENGLEVTGMIDQPTLESLGYQ